MADRARTGGTSDERLEAWVRLTARGFPYPPTPDLASRRRAGALAPRAEPRARLAWALAAGIVALAALLAVPQTRAALINVLQIGVVRIFLASPTPPLTATPGPTPTLLPSLSSLAGRTSLDQARGAVSFPIRLPAYPADLGEPDYVFVQDLDDSAVILVWLDANQPGRVRLSLHYLTNAGLAFKGIKEPPQALASASVNGQPAVWTEGPYILELRSGSWEFRRLIEGHVLIWTEGGLTLRLETDLPLEEAVRLAESLR